MTDIGLVVRILALYLVAAWMTGYITRSLGGGSDAQAAAGLFWPTMLVLGPCILIWNYFDAHPLIWDTVNPSQILDRAIIRLTLRKIQEDETGALYQGYHPSLLEGHRSNVISHKYVEVQVKDTKQRRTYRIPVPQGIKTAKEGVAWSFNLNEKDYNPAIQS